MSVEGTPIPGNGKAIDENDTTTKEKEEAGENKRPKRVAFVKLFAFADTYDCVLMFIGSVGACIHGASVPFFFVFFGKLINIMGTAYLFPAAASHSVAKYSLDFVYLSVVILFSSWTEGSTGDVISAITSDIIVVQDAISEKVGNFMHYISRFIAGFSIGFFRVWQITLVTLSIVPLIALAGGVYAFVVTDLIARVRKSYVKAGEIAEEKKHNEKLEQIFNSSLNYLPTIPPPPPSSSAKADSTTAPQLVQLTSHRHRCHHLTPFVHRRPVLLSTPPFPIDMGNADTSISDYFCGQSDYFSSTAKFSNTSSSTFNTGRDVDDGISNKFSTPLAATTTTIQIQRLLHRLHCTGVRS
ncbi:hypothetical protein RHMOL_Rhmol07G0153300 [Rhododendron molle]|uniref:Uncharacterized protein n=1 Tax=Rhododendron molle TaxID=49168 RepID=A0ACC0N1X8_RHOML|nr:hypothetical protein RHMOL_Rhmol07G0153300 [Rhododendron molle]